MTIKLQYGFNQAPQNNKKTENQSESPNGTLAGNGRTTSYSSDAVRHYGKDAANSSTASSGVNFKMFDTRDFQVVSFVFCIIFCIMKRKIFRMTFHKMNIL